MLWNWYTIDSCFLARSWHVRTKGQFAGSCIGSFLLVLSAQWLHRVAREYDAAIARRKLIHSSSRNGSEESLDHKAESLEETIIKKYDHQEQALSFLPNDTFFSNMFQPVVYTLSHKWFHNFTNKSSTNEVYPELLEHLIRSMIFVVQWGQSYIIMLLFMYYNGYIIISCLLGALFGRLLFNYEPISCVTKRSSEENDRKCCL